MDAENLCGIGLWVCQIYDENSIDHRGDLIVVGVLPGSAGEQANVQPGDRITEIDGTHVSGVPLSNLVEQRLRGTVGDKVHLKILRVSRETFETSVIRDFEIIT